jgi:hypothetical protein
MIESRCPRKRRVGEDQEDPESPAIPSSCFRPGTAFGGLDPRQWLRLAVLRVRHEPALTVSHLADSFGFTTGANDSRSISREGKDPLIARFPTRAMMLDDAQTMAPDERENVFARRCSGNAGVPPRRSVRGRNLLRPTQHREGRHLDEQERSARLEQPRHAGQRL